MYIKTFGKELVIHILLAFAVLFSASLGYWLCSTPVYAIIAPLKIVTTVQIGIKLGMEVCSLCGVSLFNILILIYKMHFDGKNHPEKIKLPWWLTLIEVSVVIIVLFISFGVGVNLASENATLKSIIPKDNDCISEEQKNEIVKTGFTVEINDIASYDGHERENFDEYTVNHIEYKPKSIVNCISMPLINLFEQCSGITKEMTIYLDPIYDATDNSGHNGSISEDSSVDNSKPANTETNEVADIDEAELEHHFVILYDVSYSMGESDSNGWVRDSVAQFVKRISPSMFPIKLAILPFAGECPERKADIINQIYGNDWIYLEARNIGELDKLTSRIQKLKYEYPNTDIGKAFEKCNQLLNDMSKDAENCSQMVLFITDGFIDTKGDNDIKFATIADSYNKVIAASKAFPIEARFVGIVPDDGMRKSQLIFGNGIDENHNRKVKKYYTYDVPPEYAYKVESYTKCVSEFLDKLKKRQSGHIASNVYEVNWADKNVSNTIDEIYNKIFENEFNTKTNIFYEKDLDSGVSFNVPEIVNNLTINIRSGSDDSQSQKNDIARWRDRVSIICNSGEPCKFNISTTEYALIINVENISPGVYTLKCNDATSSILLVNAYGDIKLSTDGNSKDGVVGEEMTFCIAIEDLQNPQDYTSVEVYDKQSGKNITSTVNIKYENGKYTFSFIPDKEGVFEFILKVTYDDTEKQNDAMGISTFQTTEVFTVHVKQEPSPAPDNLDHSEPSDVTSNEASNDDWLKDVILAFIKAAGVLIIMATGMAVITSTVRHQMEKQSFIVKYPDGSTIKYRFVKSKYIKKYRKFKEYGLTIRNSDKGRWEYSSRGNIKTIGDNDIIEL